MQKSIKLFLGTIIATNLLCVSRLIAMKIDKKRVEGYLEQKNLEQKLGKKGEQQLDVSLEKTITTHDNEVLSMAFSPDGKFLATGSIDKTAKIWDVDPESKNYGKAILTLESHNEYEKLTIGSLAFSPDGKRLATLAGASIIKIWNIDPTSNKYGNEIKKFDSVTAAINSLAFSPDGRHLATGLAFGTAALWDADPASDKYGHVIKKLQSDDDINSVAFSPDGKRLATGSDDRTTVIWDIDPESKNYKEVIITLEGHSGNIDSVAFSSDGKYLATGSNDTTVRIWDVDPDSTKYGDEIKKLEGHKGSITSVAFRHDGKYLITGSNDKRAKIWDIKTGECLFTLNSSGGIRSVIFSRTGMYIATGSSDGTVQLWQVKTHHDFLKEKNKNDDEGSKVEEDLNVIYFDEKDNKTYV